MNRRVAQLRGALTQGGQHDERGSAAAELAVALPAVVIVVALGMGGLLAASTQVRLQDVAADAARIVARGEAEERAAGVVAQVPGAASDVSWRGELVCVVASAEARVAGVAVPLRAEACALGGGR
ncbi:TadE family type IV pilus minor pilin [Microbacterium sp. NPDC096154]|uniref:TadE family type IV pilus minor pilin n=1 Tax=Microbacterium sp. NPDC096154 TaxID=3155549 RepID=UPI00332B3E47